MERGLRLLPGILLFALLTLVACHETTEPLKKAICRSDFIKGKSFVEMKRAYAELADGEKLHLWKEKIAHLQTLELPEPHLIHLAELEKNLAELDNISDLAEHTTIMTTALALAQMTPAEDFIRMFCSLEDYTYPGAFTGSDICYPCVTALSGPRSVTTGSAVDFRGGKCNCKWTCSFMETFYGGETTDDCTSTSSGCGFLWTQPCDKRWE